MKLATVSKTTIINGLGHVAKGGGYKVLEGSIQILGPLVLFWTVVAILQNVGDVRDELALKKNLVIKLTQSLDPALIFF